MQNVSVNTEKIKKIENLLEKVLDDLTNLTEENFNQKFQSAKSAIIDIKRERAQNWGKFNSFKPSNKIVQLAKLIPAKYDNVTKDWADKLNLVQKEIELSQNRKKISIYNR